MEEASVTPDENGEWHYAFTAPKYDADGNEIAYTVEETPVAGFVPSYNGFDILNTYIPPVEIDPPLIEKVVEGENAPETQFSFLLRGETGAPMPEGSDGNTKIVTLTGSGEAELSEIVFEKAGIYTYTISELNTGVDGWEYDDLVNTYIGTTPEPTPDPGDDEPSTPSTPGTPGDPSGPQTGDNSHIEAYFIMMILSLAALIVTVLLGKRETRRMRRPVK